MRIVSVATAAAAAALVWVGCAVAPAAAISVVAAEDSVASASATTSTGNTHHHHHHEDGAGDDSSAAALLLPNVHSEIQVIGAGLSRTGTVSMVRALDQIGFKTYHMKDLFSLTGHFDAWHRYYFPSQYESSELLSSSSNLGDVMGRIERDGFNATMDEPTNLHFEELLERYPNAKVILNLRRGGGYAWADSFLESVYPIPGLMERRPFSWFSTVRKQSQLLRRIYDELGVSSDPQLTDDERRDQMTDHYERWVRHVREVVPPPKLLEFYVQDGWGPLCAFLAGDSPTADEACGDLLRNDEAFPHANDGNFVRRIVRIMGALCTLFDALPALLIVAATLAAYVYGCLHEPRPQIKSKQQ